MSSSSSMTRMRRRAFIRASYHPGGPIPAAPDDAARVARVLICEPHDDITALLELVVRRLGHEPVAYPGAGAGGGLDRVDAAVIEPGEREGLALAQSLRTRSIPVLFTSIYPAESSVLALEPDAYLVKPFPLYALERALEQALAKQPAAVAVG
jgi:CheY-like chemotaxis protein